MRILYIGDIVGEKALTYLEKNLSKIKANNKINLVIANAENVTYGRGLSKEHYTRLMKLGIFALTMGNHTFDNRKIFDFIDRKDNIVRPLNLTLDAPGQGLRKFELKNGESLVLINFVGRA